MMETEKSVVETQTSVKERVMIIKSNIKEIKVDQRMIRGKLYMIESALKKGIPVFPKYVEISNSLREKQRKLLTEITDLVRMTR